MIFQAGASPRGIGFAARHGEAIFNTATRPEVMRPWVDRLRAQAEQAGRDPRSVKVFTLVTIITAPTDEEARAKYEEYAQYVSYDGALNLYGGWSGLDLSSYPPDEPLEYAETQAVRSAVEAFSTADPDRKWTPRDIANWVGIGGMGAVVVGSPATVADELQRWMEVGDVDGFNCAYAITPGTFEDVVELVVPELQRRGVYPTEYEGETLRETIYGKGQVHVRDDHPAAAFRASNR